MKIRSLGRRTDLIFAHFSGLVKDCGDYTLIQTPNNPGYHWGNYIIFDRAPRPGDLQEWKALFDREFPYYKEPHHYAFTWDTDEGDKGDPQEFVDRGFEFDSAIVLTAESLRPPRHPNEQIEIKKIMSPGEWEEATNLQILCADPKYLNDYYKEFKRNQMLNYRKMSQAGKGNWFGAFLEGKLVGDLGVFYHDRFGRYQSVGTHPQYRKQGICGSLVYQAGKMAFEEYGVKHLVMEADPEYHAAKIYESVGFKQNEINHSLTWWRSP